MPSDTAAIIQEALIHSIILRDLFLLRCFNQELFKKMSEEYKKDMEECFSVFKKFLKLSIAIKKGTFYAKLKERCDSLKRALKYISEIKDSEPFNFFISPDQRNLVLSVEKKMTKQLEHATSLLDEELKLEKFGNSLRATHRPKITFTYDGNKVFPKFEDQKVYFPFSNLKRIQESSENGLEIAPLVKFDGKSFFPLDAFDALTTEHYFHKKPFTIVYRPRLVNSVTGEVIWVCTCHYTTQLQYLKNLVSEFNKTFEKNKKRIAEIIKSDEYLQGNYVKYLNFGEDAAMQLSSSICPIGKEGCCPFSLECLNNFNIKMEIYEDEFFLQVAKQLDITTPQFDKVLCMSLDGHFLLESNAKKRKYDEIVID